MTDNAKELLALAERCREIREWHKTGLLCDGALRKLAAEMPAHDEHVKLRLAEDKTAIEAMDVVILLSARQQASVEEVARLVAEGCIEPSDFKVGGYPIFNVRDMALAKTAARALLAKYDIFEKMEG